jgi:hypothetical protein
MRRHRKYKLATLIHNFSLAPKVYKPAMQVQYHRSKIFQAGKRNITNQKMIGKWDNGEIALPLVLTIKKSVLILYEFLIPD